jgi:hypothetical protein
MRDMTRSGRIVRGAVGLAVGFCASALAAQPAATPTWTISAPDAALAWFTVLADWRIDGEGAFSYINSEAGERPARDADAALRRRLRTDPARGVLHFAPLYYPSADRARLALAVRAAGTSAAAPEPRATFLISAFARALPAVARRDYLPMLAESLERATPLVPTAERLAFWQHRLDSLYRPALAPHLARERLDAGRVIVAPALGAEGRLFAATPDRHDNLVAVGTFNGDPDPEAPLLAFVREVCFTAVSRAASAARMSPSSRDAARRSSLAAVRCGATLLESCLPDRVTAYRAFWIRQAGEAGAWRDPGPARPSSLRAAFDRLYPLDAELAVRVDCTRRDAASPAAPLP